MKKTWKKRMAFLLCMTMVIVSIGACSKGNGTGKGGSDGSSATQTPGDGKAGTADGKEIVITMWNSDILNTGIQNNPVADAIAEATGIRIEVQNGDSQKFKVLMAGGDLPDIVNNNLGDNGVDWATLVDSGQLMELDDLINNSSTTIKNNFQDAIQYSKEFLSTDGNLYLLPIQKYSADPDSQVVDYSGASVGFYTRYDLFKKVGSPDSKTPPEYLSVLKQMQDLTPATEAGEKVYALSGFSDWGLWMWTIPYQLMHGITNWSYGMMYDVVNKKALPTYYSDAFWDGMKFWNEAYNIGILDPEIFTQTYDNYMDKLKNGQTLVGYANWIYKDANNAYVTNGHEDWGLEVVDSGMNYMYGTYIGDAPYGWGGDYSLAITRNCENQEAAVKLLDFLYSEEGARLLGSGVEGIHWERTSDGKAQMTQAYYSGLAADTNYLQSQGLNYNKFSGISNNQILSDGFPADLTKTDAEKAKLLNPIDKIFIQDSGIDAEFAGQVVAAKIEAGEYTTETAVDLTASLVKAPSDDTKTTASQVDEYMKVAVASVVMAAPEDFDREKEKVISDINDKGYGNVAAEMTVLWEEAAKAAKKWNK